MDPEATRLDRAARGSLGPYEILAPLARGGMGMVYRARHTATDRLVALKLLHEPDDPEIRERFVLESRVAARLDHPNIVKVFDAGQVDGQRYLAMELVEGRTLDEVFGSEGVGRADKVRMLAEVCRAVHHGHLHAILHRDLKPANVLVDAAGVVRVTDFGLARVIDAAGDEEVGRLTASGIVLGTPAYMSPEQAAGDPFDIDLRSDIFSLGVMLYEALAGRRPFEGDSLFELLALVGRAEPPPIGKGVPRGLVLITSKAMARDPARRYQSAEALAQDLEAFLSGRPLSVRGSPLLDRALRRMRQRPLQYTIIGALAVVAGGTWLESQHLPGRIVIATDAPAAVYIDGRYSGRTFPGHPDAYFVPAGEHQVWLDSERSRPVGRTVEVLANSSTTERFSLPVEYAPVPIESEPPGAAILVVEPDGSARLVLEATPGVAWLPLGFARLVGRSLHHRVAHRAITVAPGDNPAVSIRFDRPDESALERAVAELEAGSPSIAEATLSEALRSTAGGACPCRALALRAEVRRVDGRLAEALADLDLAIAAGHPTADLLLARAGLREATGDPAGALADYRQAALRATTGPGQAAARRAIRRLGR